MKITTARNLDAKAVHAGIAGIHTPDLESIYRTMSAAIEDHLYHLPKKYRKGATVKYVSAGPTSSAYRFPVNGISVSATLTSSGMRIDAISREKRYPKNKASTLIKLRDEQKEMIAKNAVCYAEARA